MVYDAFMEALIRFELSHALGTSIVEMEKQWERSGAKDELWLRKPHRGKWPRRRLTISHVG